MSTDFQELINEQAQIVEGIRQKWEDVEKGIYTKSEAKEYEEKANSRYDELSGLVTKSQKDLTDRIDELETRLNRPGVGGENKNEPTPESKAFSSFLRKGTLGPDEKKALTISDDTGVGYLAPKEFVGEIIKGVVEMSPMRSLARVRTTSRNSIEIPKRTGEFAAVWVSETGTKAETEGLAYGMEEIPTHEMYAMVKVSQQALEDSYFNLEAELSMEFSEQFAKAEATSFTTGSAVGRPEGFTINASVNKATVVFDASDAGIIVNGLIDLIFAPKSAYLPNATLIGNRSTIAYLRKAKDANNKYYWEPDFQAGTPGRILGVPIVEFPDMANCADGAYSLAFGDFKKAYTIVDRVQISVQRLVELYAASGQVGFIARKRVGGQVVLPEAIYIGVGQA